MIKTLVFITIIIALWVGILRPWLRPKESMKWFFGNPVIEWIELNLWRKSETLMWSRWLVVLGSALTAIGSFDPTMIQTLAQFLPDRYQGLASALPLVISLAGLLGERLRRDTTKPLELVAVPENAPADVKEAIDTAALLNAEAVQTVSDAKV